MTKIIGFLGKKQSGKNTACNFLLAMKLAELGISKTARLDDSGNIEVSDILGQTIAGMEMFPFTTGTVNNHSVNVDVLFENELGRHIKIYSFANALKRVCVDILGLTYEQAYGTDEEKNSITQLQWEFMPGVVTDLDLYEDWKNLINDIDSLVIYHKPGYMTAREVLQYVGTDVFRKMCPTCWLDCLMRQITKDGSELALVSDVRFPNEAETIQENNGVIIKLTRNPYKRKKDKHSSEALIDECKTDAVIKNGNMTIPEQNEALYNTLTKLKVLEEVFV